MNSGGLGSSAVSIIVDTVPKTIPTRYISPRSLNDDEVTHLTLSFAGVPQGEEGSAAVPFEADQQRRVHQVEQGYHQHAPHLW